MTWQGYDLTIGREELMTNVLASFSSSAGLDIRYITISSPGSQTPVRWEIPKSSGILNVTKNSINFTEQAYLNLLFLCRVECCYKHRRFHTRLYMVISAKHNVYKI